MLCSKIWTVWLWCSLICQKFPCKLADNAQPESSVYVSSLIGLLTMICHFIKTPQTFFLFSYSRLRLRQTPAFFKSSIHIILFFFSLTTLLTKKILPKFHCEHLKIGLNDVLSAKNRQNWDLEVCAHSEYSDQPAHTRSLIRVFPARTIFNRPQGIYKKKLYLLISMCKSWFESQIFAHT